MRPSQSSGPLDGKATYAIGEVLSSWEHVIYTTIKSDDPETTGGQQVVLEPDYRAARVPANYGRVLVSPLIELKPLAQDGAPCGFSFINLSLYEYQDPLIREKYVGSFGLAIILALELGNTPDVGGRLGGPFRHALLAGQKRFDRQTLHLAALMLHDQLTTAAPGAPTQRRLDAALSALWNERDGSRRKQILLGYVNSLSCLGDLQPSDADPALPTYLMQPTSTARAKRLYITYGQDRTLRALLGYAAQVASILQSSSLSWTIVELNGIPKKASPSDFRDQGVSVLFIPETEIGAEQDDGVVLSVDELPRPDAERSREVTAALIFSELGVKFDTRHPSSPTLEPLHHGSHASASDGKHRGLVDATVMIPKENVSGSTNKVVGDSTVHDGSMSQMKRSAVSGQAHPSAPMAAPLLNQDTVPVTPVPNLYPPHRASSSATPRRDQADNSSNTTLHEALRTATAVPLAAKDEPKWPAGRGLRRWLLPSGLFYHLITILLLIVLIIGLYLKSSGHSKLPSATQLQRSEGGVDAASAAPIAPVVPNVVLPSETLPKVTEHTVPTVPFSPRHDAEPVKSFAKAALAEKKKSAGTGTGAGTSSFSWPAAKGSSPPKARESGPAIAVKPPPPTKDALQPTPHLGANRPPAVRCNAPSCEK